MATAADEYEIVLHDPSGPTSWLRVAFLSVVGLFTTRAGPANSGGMIISVVHKESGTELFRHIEDIGDDEGHLLHGIEQDLASMTADEFKATWCS